MEQEKFCSWYLNIKQLHSWVYLNSVFTKEECERIIEKGNSLSQNLAKISVTDLDNNSTLVDTTIRKNHVSWFNSADPDTSWIFQRCTSAVMALNDQYYKFDLDYIECLQYTIYDSYGDHYTDHIDVVNQTPHYRKLSFSVQLDDPNSYEGCDLLIKTGAIKEDSQIALRTQGTMIAFPSFTMHQVTPLKQGVRRSLVGWVCGPNFR